MPAQVNSWSPQSLIAVLARKGLGKTYMAKYITSRIIEASGVNRFLVMCGNRDSMHEWKQVVHPLYVHGTDLDKLAQVFEDQDRLVDEARERWDAAGGDSDDFKVPTELRMFVVFDDVGFDPAFARSKLVGEFACNHRHLGLDLIFPIQHFNQIVPMVRKQLDYIVMLQTIEADTIDKVYKQYVSRHIIDKDTFSFLLMSHTQQRGAGIVIDNRAVDAVTLEKRIFSIQSPHPANFYRLGSPQMLAWADDHYAKALDKRLANEAEPPRGYYSTRENQFVDAPDRGGGYERPLYEGRPPPRVQAMPYWRRWEDDGRFRPVVHPPPPPHQQRHHQHQNAYTPPPRYPQPPQFDAMTVRSGINPDEFPSPRSHGIGPHDRGMPQPHANPAYDMRQASIPVAYGAGPRRPSRGKVSKFVEQSTDEFFDKQGNKVRVHRRR